MSKRLPQHGRCGTVSLPGFQASGMPRTIQLCCLQLSLANIPALSQIPTGFGLLIGTRRVTLQPGRLGSVWWNPSSFIRIVRSDLVSPGFSQWISSLSSSLLHGDVSSCSFRHRLRIRYLALVRNSLWWPWVAPSIGGLRLIGHG